MSFGYISFLREMYFKYSKLLTKFAVFHRSKRYFITDRLLQLHNDGEMVFSLEGYTIK